MKKDEKKLTKKQQYIYNKLVEYINKHNYSPTIEELKEMTGYTAIGSIFNFLNKLEEKGYIKRKKNMPRSITLVDPEHVNEYEIPVLDGLYAGCNIRKMIINSDKKVKVNSTFIPESSYPVFIIYAKDKAIEGINIGTTVFVEYTDQVKNGDIVLFIYDDLPLLRYYYTLDDGSILLKSDNRIYADIIEKKENIEILGRVMAYLTTLQR